MIFLNCSSAHLVPWATLPSPVQDAGGRPSLKTKSARGERVRRVRPVAGRAALRKGCRGLAGFRRWWQADPKHKVAVLPAKRVYQGTAEDLEAGLAPVTAGRSAEAGSLLSQVLGGAWGGLFRTEACWRGGGWGVRVCGGFRLERAVAGAAWLGRGGVGTAASLAQVHLAGLPAGCGSQAPWLRLQGGVPAHPHRGTI